MGGSSQLQELQENKRPSSSRPDDLYIRYEGEGERGHARDGHKHLCCLISQKLYEHFGSSGGGGGGG